MAKKKAAKRAPKNTPKRRPVKKGVGKGGPHVWMRDEVIERVMHLLTFHKRKSQIKDELTELVGKAPSAATVEKIILRARARLMAENTPKLEDSRMEAISLYRSIIEDDSTAHETRIRAQEQLDKIMGHDARLSGAALDVRTKADMLRRALDAMENDGA